MLDLSFLPGRQSGLVLNFDPSIILVSFLDPLFKKKDVFHYQHAKKIGLVKASMEHNHNVTFSHIFYQNCIFEVIFFLINILFYTSNLKSLLKDCHQ